MSKLQQALAQVKPAMVSTRELQHSQYRAAQHQPASVRTENYGEKTMGLLKGVVQFADVYDKQREAEGQKRKNEIMQKNMSPEQLRTMREEGLLLYQDDVYAMRALDRALGRQESYAVDGIIQQRIGAGNYMTREDMEKDRSLLMETRLNEMSEAYGVTDDNKGWFHEGFSADATDRSFAIYTAFDKKLDQLNRTNATVAVNTEVAALLDAGKGSDIITVLEHNKKTGVIRSDAEYVSHLVNGMKQLSERPNTADTIAQLADQPITVHGQETTVRQHLGPEAIRSLGIKSAEVSLSGQWETQQVWMEGLSHIANPDFTEGGYEKGMDAIQKLTNIANLTQGDMATSARVELERATQQFNAKHKEWNDGQVVKVMGQQQQRVRLTVLDEVVNGRLTGDLTHSLELSAFTESERTGKFEPEDWNRYYDFKTKQIDAKPIDDTQKEVEKLRLGALLKDNKSTGFGAHYGEKFNRVGAELATIHAAATSGAEPPPSPELDKMMAMYKASPELFSQTFGPDFPMANTIVMAGSMGVDPTIIIKGQARLEDARKKGPEQARMMTKELENLEAKSRSGNSKNNIFGFLSQEQRETIHSLYMGMDGYNNSMKVSQITEMLNNQYTVVGDSGIVSKSFLMTDPTNPKSYTVGQGKLEAKAKQLFPTGNTLMYQIGDRIVISSPVGGSYFFTKDMLMVD